MSNENPASAETTSQAENGAAFPVVHLGASAGGLETLQQLLRALPPDTGMGFVIAQQFVPDQPSSLVALLSLATEMPVGEAHDAQEVEPNHVYLIPPGCDMIIAGGKLRLLPQPPPARHPESNPFVPLGDVNTLRRALDFSENIVASVPVPLAILDAGLRVKMASRSFYAHFQVAPETTMGRLIYDLDNGQWDIPALRTLLEEQLPRDQTVVRYEVRHTFEALGPRIMLLNARRLEHASGDEPSIILSIEDITERVAADARAPLAALVESSDDAIVSKNLDGMITSWNRGAERLFGYRAAEILEQPGAALIPPERQHEEAQILGQIRRGEAVESFETVRRRRDGTLFDVSLTASPIRDAGGKIIGASKIARDITARKRAEEKLRTSEALHRSIGESIPFGVWICERDGRNIYASQSFLDLVGLTQEQCSGLGWGQVLHPDEAAPTLTAWLECVRTGSQWNREHRVRGVDGQWHHVLARGMPVKDENGNLVQWAGINLDISDHKAAEKALSRSELRFRTAVSIVSSLLWTNNAEGKMKGEQPGWGNFTGQPMTEYQDYGWAKAVHPEDAQPSIDAWNEAVTAKRMFEFEHRIRRADGEWRLCSIRAVPILDDAGAILEWVGVHNDITESREAEAALRASEARAHAFITASSHAVYRMNADWSEMAPLDGRHFLPDSLEPSRTWLDDNFFPEDHPKVLAAIGEAIRTKSVFALKHRVRRVDGTEGWTISRAVPILDERGDITEWFGTASDVTVQHEAEEALRVSEGFKLSIIKSSPDCIKVLDHVGNFLSLETGHDLLGISDVTPLIGTSWLDLWLDPKDHTAAVGAVATALAGGTGTFVGFFRNLRGEDKWWDVAVTLIHDASGAARRLLAVSRDVTERRALDDALVARADELALADRSKDEFLAMLAHELRNPLAPLRNAAELLKADDVSPDERAQAQRVIGRQIENMSRMLEDLLDVSRITAGKIELRPKPVALESILTAAASLVRSTCVAQKQDLAISLPKEPVYLNADATRLEQVFGNLLNNASKYSGEGRHISLTAERVRDSQPPEVVVTVRDDGAGIDEELLPHIFDLFVQSSRTLDRSHGGLGIGLTLVQRLVKLHGGRIEAHSEGHGHGAEFVVHLPILAEAPPTEPPAPAPSFQASPGPTHRILIVDDNADAARSLAILQKRRGHLTRTAFTGPDAVAAAGEFLPDVVLLDIGLPGMDGFEVARNIRAMPALSGALLIAMSGYGREEDRAEAELAGFDAYLVKPVDLDVLRDWLQNGRRS